jgi:surface polysaccharide O-acyltransferase-like enzyme
LRIYLLFLIIASHCYLPNRINKKKIIHKIIYNRIHAPTFYVISFFFCHKLFKSKNISKIKIRFERLLIPYFIWPIIIWSLNNLLSFLFLKTCKISFKDLILQILTGHVFMRVLWYQYDLIFFTLLMAIIHLLFNEKLISYILINLNFFSLFLQYSNYNFIFFSQYDFVKKYPFGRFFEIVPYCIIGYILESLNLVHILSKNKIISINIFVSILILNIKHKIFFEIRGFTYQGLKLYISSITIFSIFSLIPNKIIANKYIVKFIELISIHTAGIYFIHLPLYNYFCIFSLAKNMGFFGIIIIYFISYFICLFGKIIFRETKLIYLFM